MNLHTHFLRATREEKAQSRSLQSFLIFISTTKIR